MATLFMVHHQGLEAMQPLLRMRTLQSRMTNRNARVSVPVRACIYLLRRLVQQRRELVILMLQLNQRLLCLHHHLQMTAQRH